MGPLSASPGATTSVWRPHFLAVMLLFVGNGVQAGAYTLLVADLAQALRLGPGPLGVALAALSAGAAAGVLVFGRVADRWGRRPVLIVGCTGAGSFFVALGQVTTYPVLLAAMAVGGLLLSAFDLSPTTIGGDYERRHAGAAMTLFFAGQDAGVALGALSCGLALAAGVEYSVVYAALGVALVALAMGSVVLPLPTAPHDQHATARGADPDRSAQAHLDRAEPGAQPTPLLRRGVLLAATFVALISLVDAAMEGYSSLYLRGTLGAGPGLAGAAIAVSAFAGGAGRVASTTQLTRRGERRLLVASGAAAAGALVLVVGTGLPAVAAVGLLLLRFCQAPIIPIAYSLAARSQPARSGQAASVSWMTLYLAFLTGPLLVGALSELVGLRAALAAFVMPVAAIATLAATLARPVLRDGSAASPAGDYGRT